MRLERQCKVLLQKCQPSSPDFMSQEITIQENQRSVLRDLSSWCSEASALDAGFAPRCPHCQGAWGEVGSPAQVTGICEEN